MTEENKYVYLFVDFGGIDKYTPYYDRDKSIPSFDDFFFDYMKSKPIDMTSKRLVFKCEQVKTEVDEKRLRSHDLLQGGPGRFMFVNDKIMDCLRYLIDKDIQVLPSEIYTKNGLVEGYHLIHIISTVHGIDEDKSTYWIYKDGSKSLDKLVPKNEDFMGGHEMACEAKSAGWIYITPKLREKLLNLKKGKLKGLEIRTAKEDWEACHTESY